MSFEQVLSNIKFDKIVDAATKAVNDNPLTAFAVMLGGFLIFRRADMIRDGSDYNSSGASAKLLSNSEHTLKKGEFDGVVDGYSDLFSGARETTGVISTQESIDVRKEKYASMVNSFYNIVTDFYEYGWGQSFHFAPRYKGESFVESIARAEYHLASRLGLKPGMRVLDAGCGVSGPMRNIHKFSGAEIKGLTINHYQVNIGNKYSDNMGIKGKGKCEAVQGDFQALPLPFGREYFDSAYEIEATCHSPDRVVTFKGVFDALKPGGMFAGYEWVMTNNFDPKNKDHVRIKEGIEVGNALPTLVSSDQIAKDMEAAGFEMVDAYDANENVHEDNQIPWYDTLCGHMTLSGFRMTLLGRNCTHAFVFFLECIGIAPRGSTKISALLNKTAIDLVDGGKAKIFTPSWFFIGRKPVPK